jgi:hypothetical protein
MAVDDDKRVIGRQLKRYLAVNRISREQFCFDTKLGKSTVDKLMTGIYSDATLQIVLERTNFVRSNMIAAKSLGGYLKSMWLGYISDYLFLEPDLTGSGSIVAAQVSISWSDEIPGLVLYHGSSRSKKAVPLGELVIPHERSPLIYVQPVGEVKVGRSFFLSTMFRRPIMRGLMLTVNNILANAYVPTAVPVSLRRLEKDVTLPAEEMGTINADIRNLIRIITS